MECISCWGFGHARAGRKGKHATEVKSSDRVLNAKGREELTEEVLSADKQEKLSEFRKWLGKPGAAAQDYQLLRFLRARKWVVDAAVRQFEDTQRWRAEHDVDRYRRNAPGPLGSEAAAAAARSPALSSGGVEVFPELRLVEWRDQDGAWLYYGQTIAFGSDREGHPIHLQRMGVASGRFRAMWGFAGANQQRRIIDGYIRMQELQAARMEEASARLGRRVSKQVVIMDVKGLNLWPDPRALAVFKEFLIISQTYYPETLALQFFVNVPMLFMAIWRIIHGWLDPTTAQKMHILGSNFQETLLQYIDADQLPREYGGKNDFNGFRQAHSRADCERFFEQYASAAATLHGRTELGGPSSRAVHESSAPHRGTQQRRARSILAAVLALLVVMALLGQRIC